MGKTTGVDSGTAIGNIIAVKIISSSYRMYVAAG
jgi:hypothetical protein